MLDPIKSTILFLSADPSDAVRLRLGQEQREIHEKLRLAQMRDQFVLEVRSSVRPGDMVQALLDTRPRIVHFSGHGTDIGQICLENEAGEIHPVDAPALEELFRLVKSNVECVVLNACYSITQARVIAKHIDFVIGMSREIGDEAAINFSAGFYRALGAGSTVEEAFRFGVVELRLLNIAEHLTPTLHKKRKSSKPKAGGTIEAPSPTSPRQSTSASILVVDDELDTLQTIKKSLANEGYLITTAYSYEQALQQISQDSFDLVILDIRMPDWTGRMSKRAGVDILIEIRAKGLTMPVIMLSAVSELKLAVEAMKYGATDYVLKGDISIRDFAQKIREHLK